MAANIHIIPASEFMVSSAEGEFSLEDTREFLRKSLQTAHLNHQSHVLLDIRDGSASLRAFEVFQLVAVLDEMEPPFRGRLAVLNRPKDAFNRAEFFSRCAKFRGFDVEAFQEFENAIRWMYPPEPPVTAPTDAIPTDQG